MKKTITILLAFIMTISLCACGSKEPADPNLLVCGDYSLLYKGCEITVNEDGENTLVVTYDYTNNSKDECSYWWALVTTMTQGGEELENTTIWDGDHSLTAVNEENVAPGNSLEVYDTVVLRNLEDDVQLMIGLLWGDEDEVDTLTIPLADAVGYESAGKETEEPKPLVPEPQETDDQATSLQQWWSGDWYGWWTASFCGGDYDDESWENQSWDCCGTMDVDQDGNARLVIWDEALSKDDPFAEIALTISKTNGDGEMGAAIVESGYFMDM